MSLLPKRLTELTRDPSIQSTKFNRTVGLSGRCVRCHCKFVDELAVAMMRKIFPVSSLGVWAYLTGVAGIDTIRIKVKND